MESGISEMINSVLSNPDALGKLMNVMPAVAQMMNGNTNNQDNKKQDKIVETTLANSNADNSDNTNKSDAQANQNANLSAENLMANAEVMNALKNLITALNAASTVNNNSGVDSNGSGNENQIEERPEAVTTSAPVSAPPNMNNIESIVNMLSSAAKSQGNISAGNNINENENENAGDNTNGRIEKTLDTLKNFSSATSPEGDNRSKLLLALKPFLRDERKTKIDTAIKYMNAAKIITLFGKNGFV